VRNRTGASWFCPADLASAVNVSRETPGPPPEARAVFGSGLATAMRYADLLVGAGIDRGLIGPREAERVWDRHLLNCAVLAEGVPAGAEVCDIGSGAGLPGLALAIARPDIDVLLVEPLERRAAFLAEAVEYLGLVRVGMARSRAEDLAAPAADVVTARAVAPLDRLARWCLPLVRPGGSLLAMKGLRAPAELAAAEPVLRHLGATAWQIRTMGLDVLEHPTTVVVVTAGPSAVDPDGRPVPGTREGRP
jgi:16S rRNA (guanine527-N7)-methyltransferase